MFGRLGQRIGNAARIGGKIMSHVGRMGQRAATAVGHGIDTVSAIPLVGGMVAGSAPVQALRGLVSGVSQVGGAVSGVGAILEKGGTALAGISMV